jgi:hypothetical protein
MYVMLESHPDICFAVNKLSQFSSNPNKEHLAAAVCVLQYLKKMQNLRLIYDRYGRSELLRFSNSDWASDPDLYCSTTGYMFQINGRSIAWATQKWCTITVSSTESEYMVVLESAKHTIWMIQLVNITGNPWVFSTVPLLLPVNTHTPGHRYRYSEGYNLSDPWVTQNPYPPQVTHWYCVVWRCP